MSSSSSGASGVRGTSAGASGVERIASGASGVQRIAAGASGVERIAEAFASRRRRAALMPYLMGGYPSLERSLQIGEACVGVGADLLEVGVPYSDPLADGPVIQEAGARALAAGARLTGVLEVVRALAPSVPVVLMCYANVVLAPGAEAFLERLSRTGACGLIVPDLPLEESSALLSAADALGMALVPLVAPTTPRERFAQIGDRARGFLYAVSVVGTTGERDAPSERFARVVGRAKACTQVPVAVGFGISTAEHAREAARAGADGVVVGSRLVRAAGERHEPAGAVAEALGEVAGGLEA
jgi:tryptophan synthase alpha chain